MTDLAIRLSRLCRCCLAASYSSDDLSEVSEGRIEALATGPSLSMIIASLVISQRKASRAHNERDGLRGSFSCQVELGRPCLDEEWCLRTEVVHRHQMPAID